MRLLGCDYAAQPHTDSPPHALMGPSVRNGFRLTGRRRQLKRQEGERQKGPGTPGHPALGTGSVSTLTSCPRGLPPHPHAPYSAVISQEPILTCSDSILIPLSQTTHPPPNHVTKASLIYLGLLGTAIQDGPCLSSLP